MNGWHYVFLRWCTKTNLTFTLYHLYDHHVFSQNNIHFSQNDVYTTTLGLICWEWIKLHIFKIMNTKLIKPSFYTNFDHHFFFMKRYLYDSSNANMLGIIDILNFEMLHKESIEPLLCTNFITITFFSWKAYTTSLGPTYLKWSKFYIF